MGRSPEHIRINGLRGGQVKQARQRPLPLALACCLVLGAPHVAAQSGLNSCKDRDPFALTSFGCDPVFPGMEAMRGGDSAGREALSDVDERIDQFRQSASGEAGTSAGLGQWSLFAIPEGEEGSPYARGSESDLKGFSLGIDYRVSDWASAGVALGYSGAADAETVEERDRSRSVTLFGSFSPSDQAYFDVYAGYSDLDLANDVPADAGLAGVADRRSALDGDRVTAGVAGGLDWSTGQLTAGARARMDYAGTEYVGDAGELDEDELRTRSLTSRLGLRSSLARPFSWGVVVPSATISYVHEFEDKPGVLDRSLLLNPGNALSEQVDTADRNYFIGGLGASADFSNGTKLFIEYERLLGHRFLETWSVTGGVRHRF